MPALLPVALGVRPDLSDAAAAPPDAVNQKREVEGPLEALGARLDALTAALAAEGTRSVLVVLQGRDTSGKDGVIRRVFGRMNPAFCQITSFKQPTPFELRHDFLWRVHAHVPPRGVVGIWNRSHYEDVLVARVHGLVPEAVWRERYRHINAFEEMLAGEGTRILKFMLHISRGEQLERLRERLDDPAKNWKFHPGDLRERERWEAYTDAYAEAVGRCSTPWAPWYIVPSDKNRPRDFLLAEVLVHTLESMAPRYPAADPEVLRMRHTFT